jgi:hypothetical protein
MVVSTGAFLLFRLENDGSTLPWAIEANKAASAIEGFVRQKECPWRFAGNKCEHPTLNIQHPTLK